MSLKTRFSYYWHFQLANLGKQALVAAVLAVAALILAAFVAG